MSNYNTLVTLGSNEPAPLSGGDSNDDGLGKKWSGMMSLRRIVVISLAVVGVILVALKAMNTSTPLDAMMRLQAQGDSARLSWSTTSLWQSDAGSGATLNLFIWKANNLPTGCHEIATIATSLNANPGWVPCIYGTEGVDFVKPSDYTKIWTDAGSGADKDYSLWQPACPGGFVSLSGAPWLGKSGTNFNFDEQGVYCVAHKYTIGLRYFLFVWNDGGSGAKQDGSVWGINNAFGYWAPSGSHGFPAVNTYILNIMAFPWMDEDRAKMETLAENSQKA